VLHPPPTLRNRTRAGVFPLASAVSEGTERASRCGGLVASDARSSSAPHRTLPRPDDRTPVISSAPSLERTYLAGGCISRGVSSPASELGCPLRFDLTNAQRREPIGVKGRRPAFYS